MLPEKNWGRRLGSALCDGSPNSFRWKVKDASRNMDKIAYVRKKSCKRQKISWIPELNRRATKTDRVKRKGLVLSEIIN